MEPVNSYLSFRAAEEDFGAEPGLRESEKDQCDGIPVRAEVAVPGGGCTESGEDHADASADEGMAHWTARSQPCGDVAADDAEDNAIGSGKEQRFVGGVFAERWENTELVEEHVGDERENHDKKKASHDSPNALTEAAGLRSCGWCRRHKRPRAARDGTRRGYRTKKRVARERKIARLPVSPSILLAKTPWTTHRFVVADAACGSAL